MKDLIQKFKILVSIDHLSSLINRNNIFELTCYK